VTLRRIDRAAAHTTESIVPPVTPSNAPFWTALKEGRLVGQFCTSCKSARFPVGPICPYCGSDDFNWRELSGEGTVFSWVCYHRSYMPEFADLMPYVVVLVELAEGIRLFGRYISSGSPSIGAPVRVAIERWSDGACVPVFADIGEQA
jgi:hypothetical protein